MIANGETHSRKDLTCARRLVLSEHSSHFLRIAGFESGLQRHCHRVSYVVHGLSQARECPHASHITRQRGTGCDHSDEGGTAALLQALIKLSIALKTYVLTLKDSAEKLVALVVSSSAKT